MKFMCFGGGAAVVADDDYDEGAAAAAAVEAAAHRHRGQRPRTSLALSFRRKFLSGGKKKKKPSPSEKGLADSAYDSSSVSVASSAPLTLMSSESSAEASRSSSSRSSSVSASSVLRALPSPDRPTTPERRRQASPTIAGAAAVALCLLTVVLCGKIGATLLTSTAFYFVHRRWPAPARQVAQQRPGQLRRPVAGGERQDREIDGQEEEEGASGREDFVSRRSRKQ